MPITPKDYVTLSARMPRELVETVTRYAQQHRRSISELIRDGLEWRIEQDTPGLTAQHTPPDSNQDANAHTDVLHVLQNWLPVLQDTIRQTLNDVRHDVRHNTPSDVPQEQATSEDPAGTAPDFDTSKYYLGTLCRKQPEAHEHGTTGKTRRRIAGNACYWCNLEGTRQRREKQRQAASPEALLDGRYK